MTTNDETHDSIDDIGVPIHFSLGDLSLPLGQFKSIQPGFVFELAAEPTNPVTITAGGATIGVGELVLVDGRLAIHLTEVADNGT